MRKHDPFPKSGCDFSDNEGRDNPESTEASRRVVFGPIGALFALAVVAFLAFAAVGIICGVAP